MSRDGVIYRRAVGDAVDARLRALPGPGPQVSVYRGELPEDPPVLPDYGGRVGPYVIHYLSAGTPMPEEDVAAAHVDLRLTIMLTYVAGYSSDLEALLDRCQPWVYRWAPALPGLGVGHLSVPPGYDPGPARINEDVRPPRFWTPFQYNLDITT